ncbi:hypothetical protein CROQUDRAFT_653531 [Cronartium quercuum f. sp. fusiforme G11]|uniref:Histidine kinase/HSP90-like ATPase domain-containing protein n=1 Tax=Cronartium quercuum f. sp. fusiforme G11 TaxID=708437 RepID=A0A9P6NSD9_9BASI|nr:hypothetical protein CROQUDRAFT_653531 [Cronartium quercuum f. sp. fusiforme G11]
MRLTRTRRLLLFVTLSIALLNYSNASVNTETGDPAIPITGLGPDQEVLMAKTEQKFEFQSDIARLMRVVVSHLYHDRDVFLRELISNSGDALEKLRFASLTDSSVLDTAPALNISIIADKPSKRLIIRDSGVGMTREELQKNLGTIARSGTSEFLSKLEKGETTGASTNLIGQFGLGFYSSFLVADRVLVASKSNADEKQWVFESRADAAEFKISEDPRGPSLGRGTEITLYVKDDAAEYLDVEKLQELISTHSEFSTTAPIYLWTEKEEEVPIEEEIKDDESKAGETDEKTEEKTEKKTDEKTDVEEKAEKKEGESEDDEDSLKIDDDNSEDDGADNSTPAAPKTKKIKTHVWEQINTKGPIWTRDAKSVTDEEYITFYKALTGKPEEPASWIHFKGDAGRTAFHGLIYIPDALPPDFYTKTYAQLDSVRLFVRKVLITKEPSSDFLPKYFNWLKVIIDADDLPLNVGRDSLQVNRSLRQIQNIVLKKFIDHLASLAKKEPEKYAKVWKKIGTTLKVGAIEDNKNRDKLAKLLRFESSAASNDQLVGLEDYVARRKKNQKQIYFMAGSGMEAKDLAKSPFVEKLVARGYEVLYLTEPMDEMITSSLGTFEGLKFQDVAKKGLQMGDEAEDEDEKAALEAFKTEYEPLSKWIQKELQEFVSDVVISNRLTTSPCAVVADSYAWTGNMERLMAAQGSRAGQDNNFMMEMMKKAKKVFEINPKHPLIAGLLSRVPSDQETDAELSRVLRTLWDTALVRSGFNVADTNAYFERIELLLRKSVGVDETEQVEVGEIKPAPPVEVGPTDGRTKEDVEANKVEVNSEGEKVEAKDASWEDWSKVKENLKAKATEEAKESKKEPVTEEKEEVAAEKKSDEDEEVMNVLDDFSEDGDDSNPSMEGMRDQMEKLEEMMKNLKGGGEGEGGMPDLKQMMRDMGIKDEL